MNKSGLLNELKAEDEFIEIIALIHTIYKTDDSGTSMCKRRALEFQDPKNLSSISKNPSDRGKHFWGSSGQAQAKIPKDSQGIKKHKGGKR